LLSVTVSVAAGYNQLISTVNYSLVTFSSTAIVWADWCYCAACGGFTVLAMGRWNTGRLKTRSSLLNPVW